MVIYFLTFNLFDKTFTGTYKSEGLFLLGCDFNFVEELFVDSVFNDRIPDSFFLMDDRLIIVYDFWYVFFTCFLGEGMKIKLLIADESDFIVSFPVSFPVSLYPNGECFSLGDGMKTLPSESVCEITSDASILFKKMVLACSNWIPLYLTADRPMLIEFPVLLMEWGIYWLILISDMSQA